MRISEQFVGTRDNEIYALGLLQPLLEGPYLPFTNSSLRPIRLAHVLNDLLVNRRKTILEFGSGISTIITGRLIKRNGTGSRLVSIEHDAEWARIIQSSLQEEGLTDAVTVLHAPLHSSPLATDSNLWYDLDAGIFTGASFDMIVIDGPPAYEASKVLSRYPALPFVYDLLGDRFAVFLDDADRNGEREIIRRWEEEYDIQFSLLAGALAYACKGQHFNVHVL